MAKKNRILAINPGHNGSAAYVVDGELIFYSEEERLSRNKYDGNPFMSMLEAIKLGVDVLVIGGTTTDYSKLPWTGEDAYTALVRKFNPKVRVILLGHEHHLGHVGCAFYNSGFETAVAVIVDGSGSYHSFAQDEKGTGKIAGFETESIYKCAYPAQFDKVHKTYGTNDNVFVDIPKNSGFEVSNSLTIVKAYESVTHYLGFGYIEAGKTMGLAPYGKSDEKLENIFINGKGNKNYFIPNYPAGGFINTQINDYLKKTDESNDWHRDPSLVTDVAKNLAWRVQHDTQEFIGNLIEQAVDSTGETNVVIAGGYGLNCVANYYLQKRFPNLNLYFEPIAHDGGTSIGMAKLVHHSENEDSTIRPLKSLYLGVHVPNYDDVDSLEGVEITNVSHKDVAQLIADRNIVALFQGRSEAGPRALGNRSILYDPRDINGKDHVNKVKGREWFRPFAGSMLAEKFDEWFETAGLKEAPHMMYAIDFKAEKYGEVPAITHVDATCRIQTVTSEQNTHYYNLIKEFDALTGVPILFNTSFNLAGEPLVETLEDAIHTMKNSNIEYLYLPEVSKLLKIDRVYQAEVELVD